MNFFDYIISLNKFFSNHQNADASNEVRFQKMSEKIDEIDSKFNQFTEEIIHSLNKLGKHQQDSNAKAVKEFQDFFNGFKREFEQTYTKNKEQTSKEIRTENEGVEVLGICKINKNRKPRSKK